MTDRKEDQSEDRYRDDPKEFAGSADSVQRGSNTMSGGGVESSAEPVTSMSRGSQEDWRPDPEAASQKAANDEAHPQGRSDDSGRSGSGSSGGLDGKGLADDGVAADVDDAAGGTSKVAPNNPQSPDDRER